MNTITVKFDLNGKAAFFVFELSRYADNSADMTAWKLTEINGEPAKLVSRWNGLAWCGIDTPQTNRASIADLLGDAGAYYQQLGEEAQGVVETMLYYA